MNRSKLFRVILLVLISISILFLTTCEKDPTGPTDNTPITSATIGTDGGKLETEGFLLQVPVGSFPRDVTLNLSISSEESGFGERSVSESFIIEGLPDEFDKPLRLAIKYNVELSDSSFIAVGKMAYDYLSGDSSVVYHFIPIKDSTGFLIGEVTSGLKQMVNKLVQNRIPNSFTWTRFIAATGEHELKTDNFTIKYPGIYSDGHIEAFGNLFNETLNLIRNDLKFRYFFSYATPCGIENKCWKWPIEVIINENVDYMSFDYRKTGIDNIEVFINTNGTLLGSLSSLEVQEYVTRVLLTLALNTYNDYVDNYDTQRWLKVAMIDWLCSTYKIPIPRFPIYLAGSEMVPFDRMRGNRFVDNHGHGMITMLKYLIDNEKITGDKLRDILQSVHNNGNHPITGLLNTVNGLVADWWPDYFEKLIKGNIYNIDDSIFLSSEKLGDSWDIVSDEQSSSFKKEYLDLSAKRFLVNIKNTNFNEKSSLYLDATGNSGYDGVATIVFGVNNGNLHQFQI